MADSEWSKDVMLETEWDFSQVIVNLKKKLAAAETRVRELEEELADWAYCKGCFCGHPACRTCNDTKEALALCGKDWKAARREVKGE